MHFRHYGASLSENLHKIIVGVNLVNQIPFINLLLPKQLTLFLSQISSKIFLITYAKVLNFQQNFALVQVPLI